MPNTETWTKEFPKVEGDYFSRIDEYDKQPTPIRIQRYPNGVAVFEFGCAESFQREHETESYEYLGPFTASDAEQLSELRGLAQTCLTWFEWWVERGHGNEPPLQSVEVLRQLRAALNPKQPGKETR